MARSLEEILGKSINSTKELREEINRLKDSLVSVEEGSEEWVDTATKLNAAQEKLTTITAAGKNSIDAAKDSIVGMEKEYKILYNTYKLLSEEQRNSSFGKNMAAELEALSEKLNTTKQGVGNFKDNIGHYSQSVMDAFSQMGVSIGGLQGPMKLAAGGAKTLGASLKALIANPVGAIIMAIVVAFKALGAILGKVKEAIQGNEESQMRLKQAMSAFQPVIDAVSNAFDKLGQLVVKSIEGISKAFNKIKEVGAAVTDFLHITDGAKDRVKEQTKLYSDLAKAENNLTKIKRENQKLNATDKARVEELREQAAALENGAEKTRLLTEAMAILEEMGKRQIKEAQEELRILTEKSKLTANDTAMNDKLAAAEARVAEITAETARKQRQLATQLKASKSATDSYTKSLEMERSELDSILQRLDDISKTEVQKITEKYEREKALLEKYHKDTTVLTEQYNKDIAAAEKEANERRLKAMNEQFSEMAEGYNRIQQQRLDIARSMQDVDIFSYNNAVIDNLKEDINTVKGYINSLGTEGVDLSAVFAEATVILAEHLKDIGKSAIDSEVDLTNVITAIRKKIGDIQFENINIGIDIDSKNLTDSINSINSEVDKTVNNFDKNVGDSYFRRLVEINNLEMANLENKISYYEKELSVFEGTNEQKLELERNLFEVRYEYTQKINAAEEAASNLQKERLGNLATDILDFNDSLSNSISQFSNLLKANIENGRYDEAIGEKKKKRLETLQKLQMRLAQISIIGDAAMGIMGVWSAYGKEKIVNAETAATTGPLAAATLAALNVKSLASAIAQSAMLATTAAAQLASVKANRITSTATVADSSSTSAVPSVVESTPYTYSRTLQTEEEEEKLNTPIWVSVVDIADSLNRVTVRDEEITF